jgi:DNA adenine methylase
MSRKPKMHDPLPASFDEVLTAIADEQRPLETSFTARPFLKWAGGKRSLVAALMAQFPASYTSYHEPFLGGAALYFAAKPDKAVLSDINFHLIITFQTVRDQVEELIAELKIHAAKHSKPYFLKARDNLFTEKTPVKIAAWFIYLNKTCYNGLYRVNKAGHFNVPIGSYKDPAILDEANLRLCSEVLKTAEICQQSFEQIEPEREAFYYLDPPYHQTFSGYDGNGFGDEEHKKLAEMCHQIHNAGGFFLLSNSDTEYVRGLYKGFNIAEISASRSISCKGNQRGKETELVIRNYDQREQSKQDRKLAGTAS